MSRTDGGGRVAAPSCVVVAHDPTPEVRDAYREELGARCELLFLPDLAPADRAAALARARVLIAWNPRIEIGAADVDAMTSLGFVQLMTAGVDHVPLHLFPRDVPIASNAGVFAGPMAEFALAMTLAAAKRLPVEHREMRQGRFNQFAVNRTLDGRCAPSSASAASGARRRGSSGRWARGSTPSTAAGRPTRKWPSSARWRRCEPCSAPPTSSSSRCRSPARRRG